MSSPSTKRAGVFRLVNQDNDISIIMLCFLHVGKKTKRNTKKYQNNLCRKSPEAYYFREQWLVFGHCWNEILMCNCVVVAFLKLLLTWLEIFFLLATSSSKNEVLSLMQLDVLLLHRHETCRYFYCKIPSDWLKLRSMKLSLYQAISLKKLFYLLHHF